MTPEEKSLSEEILRYLCCGRNICGINFWGAPALIISTDDTSTSDIEKDTHLVIETRWQFYTQRPDGWPEVEEDIPERPIEELAYVAASVRKLRIIDAYLAEQSPHLILSFEDDKYLFINGYHDSYETWRVATDGYMIVVIPGSSVAIWTPGDDK